MTIDKQNKKGYSALMWASEYDHAEVAELLLDKRAQVDLPSANGSTAMIMACRKGHMKVVEMLHKRGASIEVELKGGAKSALAAASRARHKEVAVVLLDRCAPLGVKKENYGDFALTVARGIDAEAADLLYELVRTAEYLVQGTQRSDGYALMEEEDLGRLAAYISADHDGLQAKI